MQRRLVLPTFPAPPPRSRNPRTPPRQGAIAGAIAAGFASDRFGRTRALTLTCAPFSLGWVCIAAASSCKALYLGRLLTGFGCGAVLNVTPVYVAEVSPAQLRGTLGGVNQLGINAGLAAAFALGLPALRLTWRALAAGAVVPLLALALASACFMPESPRWLAAAGRGTDAVVALRELRPPKVDVARELSRINTALAQLAAEPPPTLGDIFRPALGRPLSIVLVLMVCQQLTGVNSVFFNLSPIFAAVGVANADGAATLVALVTLPVSLAACMLLDLAGRRTLLIGAALGMAASAACLAISFSLPASAASISHPLAVVGALCYLASFSSGLGPIPWVLMGELFPPRGKGAAASAATAVSNLAAFTVTVSFGALVRSIGMGAAFGLYCACCLGTAVYTFIALPETKGRSLEEVAALLARDEPAWVDAPPVQPDDEEEAALKRVASSSKLT